MGKYEDERRRVPIGIITMRSCAQNMCEGTKIRERERGKENRERERDRKKMRKVKKER